MAVLALVVIFLPASAAYAYAVNAIQLDNGTCGQHLQIGSDPTASSVNTPSFLLNGDGGLSSYQVAIDGSAIGTFDSNGYGDVCIDETQPLSEGSHQLTATELAPKPSNVINPFNFTVETVPLASPSEPTLDAVTDSGVVGDDVTDFTSVRLDGTSVPNVPIRILEGSDLVGGAMSGATGSWSVLTDPLALGTNVLVATDVSESGVQSAPSPALTITIVGAGPQAPPAPTLDPASGSGTTATVSDPTVDGSGASASETINVFVDGVGVGSTASNGSGSWQYALPTLAAGSHSVTASVTDGGGNTSAQSNPLILVVGPEETVPGAPSVTAVAGNGSVALTWSAPNDGGSPITGYDVYQGTSSGEETLLGVVTAPADTDTTVINGNTYYYEVSAINGVGEGPFSAEVSATPVNPGQPPAIKSASTATASMRHAFRFAVIATGDPAPTLSVSGTLPRGVKFVGTTGVISGTTKQGTKGTYQLVITASNAVGTTQQILTLQVIKSSKP